MDNPFKSPHVLSVCPGVLGLERGLIRAIGEINVAAYVEIEAFIIANLAAAMETGKLAAAPIWTDLKTFQPEYFRGKIHGIIGGYPCQPFSLAGLRNGEEDPRHLWPYVFGSVRAIGPVWCFFENVGGHLSMGFDTVYKDLRSLGYNVEAGIFTASEVGAPHQRERLFILAILNTAIKGLQDSGFAREWKLSEEVSERIFDRFEQPGFELAHSDESGLWRKYEIRLLSEIVGSSKELGNAESNNKRDDWNKSRKPKIETGRSSAQLANAGSLHDQREFGEYTDEKRRSFTSERPSGSQSLFNGWPAPPGNFQHEWEEPRTVESGVGCTIDGYNFREDLLRALGNSVVEQTAELAFRMLLHKHFVNSNQV